MGAESSRLSPRTTNVDTKSVLNFILKQMFARADLVDMYSLADPERCKRYLVVASDALEKLFVKQRLYPDKGKEGTFYFQSLEGIQKAMPSNIRAQQNENCVQIAFFFIRIFQIFSALTLSVLDSELPATDPEEIVARPAAAARGAVFLRPPGVAGFAGEAPKKSGFFFGGAATAAAKQRGGELSATRHRTFLLTDSNYKILNKYLVAPDIGAGSTDPMHFEGFANMIIPQETLYEGAPDARVPRSPPVPVVIYSFKDVDTNMAATARLTMARSGDLDIRLSDMKIAGKPTKSPIFEATLRERFPGDTAPEDDKGQALPYVLKGLFEKGVREVLGERFSTVQFLRAMNYIDTLDGRGVPLRGTRMLIDNPRGSLRGTSVPFVYKDTAKIDGASTEVRIYAKLEISKAVDPVSGDRVYTVYIDFSGVRTTPEELRDYVEFKEFNRRVFRSSSNTAEPLSDKNESIPSFLQEKFDELLKKVKEGGLTRGGIQYTREGIPKPYNSKDIRPEFKIQKVWQSLAKDPPVKAHCVARAIQLLSVAGIERSMGKEAFSSVCRLKFQLIKDGSLPEPGETITREAGIDALANLFVDRLVGSVPKLADTPKYKEFLQNFKAYFERLGTIPTEEVKSIQDIEEKAMPFCADKWDQKILVRGDLLSDLRSKARALLSRQANHVRDVMRIMFELFNEKKIRAGVLELHPKVLEGGMPHVNEIARKARDLLIEYYGDCERTYKEGLYAMQMEHKRGGLDFSAVGATATAAPPSAPLVPSAPVPSAPPGIPGSRVGI